MPDAEDVAQDVVRRAYEAYARGDLAAMLESVDEDLEWTYLDPSSEDPEPQVCHGRRELRRALERRAGGIAPQLEEVVGRGDRVLVVVRRPGIDAERARKTGDRDFDVVTVRAGRIVALRACRDRQEAARIAGID